VRLSFHAATIVMRTAGISGFDGRQKLLFEREAGIMMDGLQLTFEQPRGGCDAKLDLGHMGRREGSDDYLDCAHLSTYR
jgi:hypothetical protein